MAIITVTAHLTEKNTKSFINKKTEKEQLILNTIILNGDKEKGIKPVYGTAFLPPFIKLGDIVTVSGETKADTYVNKNGETVNKYDFSFPTVTKVYVDGKNNGEKAYPDFKKETFDGSEPFEINDEELPF